MQLIKNAMIYRLNREFSLIASEIEHQLKNFEFKGCGSQDMAKVGWFPPLGKNSESLCHVADGNILIVVKREEKIMPITVIKEELDERIEKLEVQQQRKLKKTEKDSLRDEVLHTLLPRAFSRYSLTNIWLEKSGLIIVDSASAKKAEDALALLRKTIGSLPVIPLTMESPVELTVTEWVRNGDMPAGFTLGSDAELKAILEDGGMLRVNKQDLVSDEISNHIEAGKLVTKLALNWQDRIDFVLSDDGSIKRIKLCDTIMEQNDDIDRYDQLARFDADFILQAGEISALIADTVAALGGEVSR